MTYDIKIKYIVYDIENFWENLKLNDPFVTKIPKKLAKRLVRMREIDDEFERKAREETYKFIKEYLEALKKDRIIVSYKISTEYGKIYIILEYISNNINDKFFDQLEKEIINLIEDKYRVELKDFASKFKNLDEYKRYIRIKKGVA